MIFGGRVTQTYVFEDKLWVNVIDNREYHSLEVSALYDIQVGKDYIRVKDGTAYWMRRDDRGKLVFDSLQIELLGVKTVHPLGIEFQLKQDFEPQYRQRLELFNQLKKRYEENFHTL